MRRAGRPAGHDESSPPGWPSSAAAHVYSRAGSKLICHNNPLPQTRARPHQNKVPIDSDAGPYRLSSSAGLLPALAAANGQQQQTIDKQAAKQLDGQNTAQLDLFIDNIQAGQTTGDYVCLASNSEGSIEARSQVVLAVPAVITTWPRNQTRLEGERVELLCQAKALPANITYRWLFNNRPVQQLKWFDSRYTLKRDGTLVIHSLHRDDQGEYKCQATNGLSHRNRIVQSSDNDSSGNSNSDSSSSSSRPSGGGRKGPAAASQSAEPRVTTGTPIYAEASAYLNVEFPARVTYSPPVQYLPLGLSGQIRCYVQSVPPVEFFTWTLNNQQFDPNSDPNIERLQNGSLVIKQVNESYEGQYRCTPFNKHGSAGSSAAMEVRVQEPPHFVTRPDDFYKANLNGQIKMPCEGRGSPKPSVSWRRVMQVPKAKAAGQRNESAGSAAASEQRLKRAPQLARRAGTASRHFNSHQAHLSYDEAADEPDETHQFYATTAATTTSHHQRQPTDDSKPVLLDDQTRDHNNRSGGSSNNNLVDDDESGLQPEQEQQTVIVYAKLPSDRSEYKNSYLHLHNLRKEDHGRYECVIENEVATLVASTMLYIEGECDSRPLNGSQLDG
jgi:hypothetical protein